MGTGFREFPQTPRGRGFSLLGFIPALSTLQMFESNEAIRGRLIGPKPWDRIDINFWKPKCFVVTVRAVWVF